MNNNSSRVTQSTQDKRDCITTTVALVEGTRNLSLETSSPVVKSRSAYTNHRTVSKDSNNALGSTEEIPVSFHIKPAGKDSSFKVKNDVKTKPEPCPREPKAKPVPPPRRRSPRVLTKQSHEGQSSPSLNSKSGCKISTQINSGNSTHNAALENKSSLSIKTCPGNQSQSTSHSYSTDVFTSTASINFCVPVQTTNKTPVAKPKIPPRPRKLDATTHRAGTHKKELVTSDDCVEIAEDITEKRKNSLVEILTKRFTSLSASKPSDETDCGKNIQEGNSDKPQHLFKATPVFIGESENSQRGNTLKANPIPDFSLTTISVPPRIWESNRAFNCHENVSRTGRKRCPDNEHSNDSYSKREKRSNDSCKVRKPNLALGVKKTEKFTQRDQSVAVIYSHHSATKSEMSIESAEQAVSESEISAIPLATMESEKDQCCGGDEVAEGQEIIRRNSSRSGRLDPGDASQSSGGSGQRHSSGGYSSSVPRSHSDISFRLGSGSGMGGASGEGQGGQHSRDSSIVSSHSRLSRASVGADLENFFNQMGLEMGVLEPMARLRELQNSGSTGGDRIPAGDASTFGSMSSLDSQDAASICSTYSRSEHDCVGTGGLSLGASGGAEGTSVATGHHQQQTSIVERNARIIKWLCNVRKAIKGGQSKADGGGSSSGTATGKA